jgi:hypothetical protein
MRTQLFLWLIIAAQSLVPTLADEPKPDAVSSPSVVLDEAANKIRDVAKQLTDNPMPTPAPVLVVAPELWIPFSPDNKRLDSPALIGAAGEKDGTYMLLGLPKPGDVPQYRLITIVTLTGPRPPPVVVTPPVVTPEPKPDDPVVPVPNSEITAAVWVYEKDDGEPPSSVRVALDRLNRERKILATTFDDDSVDGDGEVPDQYKAPLEAAKNYQLPVLVLMKRSGPPEVIRAPKTEQEVWDAVK